jgi:AcrR family transcriptional regulator
MSPRPRTISDDTILQGVARAIGRLGPVAVTLADMGHEVGLAPATLSQRFGSKRGLLLALTSQAARLTTEQFALLRATHPSPLAALRGYAASFALMGVAPDVLANHLAFLQLDLTDPDFHRHAAAQAIAVRVALHDLLDDALAVGELRAAPALDTARLARAVQVTLNGSLLTWALYREGAAADWVATDLETLLHPYLREEPA